MPGSVRNLCYLVACIGSAWGIFQYPGDKIVFGFFSAVTVAIAYLSLRFTSQYSHFFLGIIFLMGLWLKYLFHQITGSDYYEPHGRFDSSPAEWDSVFYVLTIGCAGYIVGRLVALPWVNRVTASLYDRKIVVPPRWSAYRDWAWIAVAILVIAVVVANQEMGLLVRGYVARVVLPWPLGGLFAWMTDIGLALLLGLLLAWDRQSNNGIVRGFAGLCCEGALVSVSTLSRGVYFFHTVPALLTEARDSFGRGRVRQIVILCAVWAIVGVAIPAATTFLRLYGENALPNTQEEMTRSEKTKITRSMTDGVTASAMWNQFVTLAQILLVDRWTGLEGVMATVSYPDRGASLFAEAATSRRSYGTVDVYTRKVSGSTFREENAKKYHYATPAGPIAFLYLSNSLILVFIGMALISILISIVELGWLWLVRDRVLLALSGLYLALVVLQLSGNLVQAVTGPVAVTCTFGAVWLIGRVWTPKIGGPEKRLETSCTEG